MGGQGTLAIGLEPAARWARIVVADSGPGVPAGSEEAIFAPFVSTKERGTGLGLAVARAAVAAHDGTLRLRPSRAGATFVITLPAVEEHGGDPTRPAAAADGGGRAPTQGS
jgi:signal transduction histidine kinase